MYSMKITKANRLIPDRLKLIISGLEVDFDNLTYTHNSVILKIGNKITSRLFWVNERQELKFQSLISEFKVETRGFDAMVSILND